MNQDYNNLNAINEDDLGYGELLTKLWNRRFWFLGAFAGVMAISIPWSLFKQPIYQSQIQILVEPNYQKSVDNRNSNEYLERRFTDSTLEVDYPTQLKVFKSAKILDQVAKKLITPLNSDEENLAEKIDYVTSYLRESLSVWQIVEEDGETATKIIEAAYVGEDPQETKRVLETIQEVYLNYNLQQQEKRLRDGLNFIDAQIPEAQSDLLKAEAAITELSKKHNLISPEEDASAIKENIRQIAQQRNELSAEQSDTKANYTALQEKLGLSPQNFLALSRLSQSERYQNLLSKLQETEILLAAEQQKFTADSPIIQSLKEDRNSQRASLVEEAQKILGDKIPPNFIASLKFLPEQGQLGTSETGFVDQITESQSSLEGIRERDLSLAKTEAELNQKLAQFPELIAQYKNLAQKAEIQREALRKLLEAKQELEIELNRGGFNWQVIEPAQIGIQIAPNLLKDLLLSLVVASFLGITAAFIRESIDGKITSISEVEPKLDLPILGTTPKFSSSSNQSFLGQLPFLSNYETTAKEVIEWQPFREALDIIYENLRLSTITQSAKSLAITSSIAGEGKSTFVLGLALSIARSQLRVLVIDADLRSPSLHEPFNLSNDFGLSDYLTENKDLPVVKQVSFRGETIDLITSGVRPVDPVKLLCSAKLKYLIEQQKANYDLILVDTPPAAVMVDAIKAISVCDTAVIVMGLGKVKVAEFLETTDLLSNLEILGVIGNGSLESARRYKAKTNSRYLLPQQT